MRSTFLLLLAGLLWSGCVAAHEIPGDVRVQVYLAAKEDRVEALLRVPLAAMRDVEFPLKGPGYLDLGRLDGELEMAAQVWLVNAMTVYADGRALEAPVLAAVRVALPSDRSFDSFDTARAAVTSDRLPDSVELYWAQALLDVALEYPNPAGESAELAVEPRFGRLGITTVTAITALLDDGKVRSMMFLGDPGRISLDPGVVEVFARFVRDGFAHVLDGKDHLLFVLVLIIPLLVIRPLVVVVTAFTLAHSLTLGAAALELVPAAAWFPSLVEVLIAATIFYMALENVLRPTLRRRWLEAFAFGLVHGFGFSFALREMLPMAGDHQLVSLAGFNLGIELGALLVLVVAVPALRLLMRLVPGRAPGIVLSALIAHTAWHWMMTRWDAFAAYDVTLPALDTAFALTVMRWLMLVLIAVFVVWLVRRPFERWAAWPVSEP
jgi:hypothetical protein